MRRTDLLTFLADEIVARKREDRPLKVGIDGRCAAGKTSLANELARVLDGRGFDVLHPSVDGFHHPRERRYRQGEYSARGYFEDAYDYKALVSLLLGPLSGTVFPIQCRQSSLDLCTDGPIDTPPVSVGANTILLFEGLFVFRSQIDSYWDYRILVDIDAETSLARDLVRGEAPVEVLRRKFEARYEPAWQIYVELDNPEAKAEVVIDNREVDKPQILKGRLRNAGPGRYPEIS